VDSPTNIEGTYHETHRDIEVAQSIEGMTAEWGVKGFQKTKWPMDVQLVAMINANQGFL
jgi:hypothetical protein